MGANILRLQFRVGAFTLSAMIKSTLRTILLFMALAPVSSFAQNPLGEVVEALENLQMQRLADQQKRPDIFISQFRSDGCSGGMSETWSNLSDIFPEFAGYAGNKPPWEHCCVDHDRYYWRGETEDGFSKRQLSDARLRACVKLTATEQGEQIAETLGLPSQEVIVLINLTGDLMYQAVRLGGAPCTGLPWRWGHGWPSCSDETEDPVSELITADTQQHHLRNTEAVYLFDRYSQAEGPLSK